MVLINIKLIEKSARSKKDPSPITSAMSTMGLKYPISVEIKKARDYKIPVYLLMKGKDGEDKHTHGRVLCKKEAVDWWVAESRIPSENVQAAIRVLYDQCTKEVERYFSIKWEDAKIKFGPPIIERKYVRTKAPIFEVPKSIQNSLIKESLFPHLTIPDYRITPKMRQDAKELIDLTLEGKMTLSSQIRILMTNLDPKVRCLPMIPGSAESVANMKHAICHTNMVLTDLVIVDKTKKNRDTMTLMMTALTSIIYEAKKFNWDLETIKKVADSFLIQGSTIEEILTTLGSENSPEIKFARALYGLPDTLEFTRDGFVTCPLLSPTRMILAKTASGVRFQYNGNEEKVNFKYGDIKGNFSHSNCLLLSATMNYTTLRDLISTLSEIAIHIKWEFIHAKKRGRLEIHEEIKRKVTKKPWELIYSNEKTFNETKWGKTENVMCGNLVINENAEYSVSGKIALKISRNLNIVLEGTNQEIETTVEKSRRKCYTNDIICKRGKMLAYFTFKEMVRYRYSYFLENWKTVERRVRNGDFKWENEYVMPYLEKKARCFSKSCRQVLLDLSDCSRWNKAYCSMLYIFCYPDPATVDDSPMLITTSEGYTIDLNAERGVFTYDKEKRQYSLFGIKSGEATEKYDTGDIYRGCLTGYLITAEKDEAAPMVTIRHLEEKAEEIREGSTFRIFINGEIYGATKDSSLTYIHSRTNSRQIAERQRGSEDLNTSGLAEKRKWLVGHIEDEEVERKKARYDMDEIDAGDYYGIEDMVTGLAESDTWDMDNF